MRYDRLILIFCFFLFSCSGDAEKEEVKEEITSYLSLGDSVGYVGMNACRRCHENIYQSFIETGMGQSFDTASPRKSKAVFTGNPKVYDSFNSSYYQPYWHNDEMFIREFRLEGKDTSFSRIEKVNYVVGSGQHTNSHIMNINGYLHQMPMTFYTQRKKWDLPPGFENGFNTRFSRKIGLECISCHNSYPGFVEGSENKYERIPDGINCERCHGPGEAHVRRKSSGEMIDTSKYIDYSIVNPGKLSADLQFDVCQRCHLQGNAILREGKSFFDFRPGMKLSDVMTVFLPKYKGGEDEFIMASHADRLKMSPCFIKSYKEEEPGSLRPYKQSMTCVTCHNPHVSVTRTGKEVFNKACRKCHEAGSKDDCREELKVRLKVADNCVSCHMPKSGTIDIPHVTTTDHYIRRPVKQEEKQKIKEFIGLHAINAKSADRRTRARAYLNQYEKFEFKSFYLDSALNYLKAGNREEIVTDLDLLVHHAYLKSEHQRIISYVQQAGIDFILKKYARRSLDNSDAWLLYRISEAYSLTGKAADALKFINEAVVLAPFNLEFLTKQGSLEIALGMQEKAKKTFAHILRENPKYPSAAVNLGYILLLEGNIDEAERLYNKALALDPDYRQAKINLAGLYIHRKKIPQAKALLQSVLKKDPSDVQVKQILESL